MDILKRLKQFIFNLENEQNSRAVMDDTIFYEMVGFLEERLIDEYWYVYEHMNSREGSYYIIVSDAKLYKVGYSIGENDEVVFQEPSEVKLQVEEAMRTSVFRDASGNLKFSSVASSSTINRVGEIDSKALYETFEKRFNNDVYLTFYHQGERLRFGHVEGVYRHGNVLFMYGQIDESTPLGRYAEVALKRDDWGVSIGFNPDPDGRELFRVADLEIPVYTKGKLVELSVLKEPHAASFFTNIKSIDETEKRMASEDIILKALTDWTGGDEERAQEILSDAKTRSNKIEEDGLITRENEIDVETEEQEELEPEVETEIVVDEELLSEVVEQSTLRMQEKLENLVNREELTDTINKAVEELLKPVYEALNALQTANEEVVEDTPQSRTRVVYRPSQKESEGEEKINTAELRKSRMESTKVK